MANMQMLLKESQKRELQKIVKKEIVLVDLLRLRFLNTLRASSLTKDLKLLQEISKIERS